MNVNSAVNALCSKNGLRIYPERSSSPHSRNILLGTVWSVAAAGSLAAINSRAWPIAVFLATVAGGLTFAFSRNVKAANVHEILRFHQNNFEIQRFDDNGTLSQKIALPSYGLKFITQGDEQEHKIFASSRQKTYPIGAFLSIPEKEKLMELLKMGHMRQSLPQHIQEPRF